VTTELKINATIDACDIKNVLLKEIGAVVEKIKHEQSIDH
jgi:hypothetical protein